MNRCGYTSCSFVYIYIYVCICISVYAHTHTYIYIYTHTHTYIYICTYQGELSVDGFLNAGLCAHGHLGASESLFWGPYNRAYTV